MTYEQIKLQLAVLTDGLLYISESERPFDVMEITGDAVAFFSSVTNLPAADFTSADAGDFFSKMIRNASADPADAVMMQLGKRYEALQGFLDANLTALRLYRAGSREVHIFISGKTANGRELALHTAAVET